MKNFILKLLGIGQNPKQLNREEISVAEEARKQFLKLKEKGLSIPVFTL